MWPLGPCTSPYTTTVTTVLLISSASPPHIHFALHSHGVSRSPARPWAPRGLSQSAPPWNRTARIWDQCRAGADAQACNPPPE